MWLAYPRWRIPCRVCEAYVFTAEGELMRNPVRGEPQPRGDSPTPCESCPKCPTWAKKAGKDWRELRPLAAELTDENRAAFDAYFRYLGSPHEPDDEVFRWHAGIVRRVMAEHAADQSERSIAATQHAAQLTLTLAARR